MTFGENERSVHKAQKVQRKTTGKTGEKKKQREESRSVNVCAWRGGRGRAINKDNRRLVRVFALQYG